MHLGPVLWLALLLGGCGGAAHHGADGGGAPDLATAATVDLGPIAADLTVAAAPDLAVACSDLTLAGAPMVTLPYLASDVPAFSGGAIVDGSYVLSSGGVYTGAGGMTGTFPGTFRVRYRFAGSHVDLFAETPGGTTNDAATFALDDNGLTITPSCPDDAQPISTLYTATTSSITLGMVGGTTGTALVLTKE